MIDFLKNIAKGYLSPLGFFLSHNQRYDWQLQRIIKGLTPTENDIVLIDIGAHKGEVTDLALRYHKAKYILFEPIPMLFQKLENKYLQKERERVQVLNLGLAEKEGSSTFNYNHTHPAYSGILRREYPSDKDHIEKITIQMDTLDHIVSKQKDVCNISLIKIDVEGGEMNVLKGARETIAKYKPLVVFEHGLGASEYYDTKPEEIYTYFQALHMNIQTMENWLKKKPQGFSQEAFENQFHEKINYYFIAYPKV